MSSKTQCKISECNIGALMEIYKDVEPVKAPIILDLGCHIGKESLNLIEAFPDFELLISVDPFEENIKKVEKLIKERKLDNKWKISTTAIDIESGSKWISYQSDNDELERMPCGNLTNETFESNTNTKRLINTKTILDIHPNPTIIKVDIEGHEWFIWEQIFSIPSVKIVFLEIHGNSVFSLPEKLQYITSQGFSYKAYAHQAQGVKDTSYIDINTFVNVNDKYCQLTAHRC